MNVVFSVPVDPQGMMHHTIAVFIDEARYVCHQRGITFDYDIHPSKPSTSTRNRQCAEFLLRHPDADALAFCDADAIPDVPSFLLMLEGIARDDVDVLYGWSVMHQGDGGLLPNVTDPANEKGEAKPSRILAHHTTPGLVEITGGGCGAHCVIMARRVVEEIVRRGVLWFEDEFHRDWHRDKDHYGTRSRGHDYWFAHRCAEYGFRVWLDNRVYWGHAKTVDLKHFYNQIQHLRQSLAVSCLLVDILREKWGNADWTASSEFLLRAAIEANRLQPGVPLVELGSGLSTVVLKSAHDNVLSFEQDDEHHALEPLAAMPGVHWYPARLFADMKPASVGMLVVDGPRSDTPGGRRGVLSIRSLMARGAVVMFDDVNREADKALVEEWCGDEISPELVNCHDGRSFAFVRMPGG